MLTSSVSRSRRKTSDERTYPKGVPPHLVLYGGFGRREDGRRTLSGLYRETDEGRAGIDTHGDRSSHGHGTRQTVVYPSMASQSISCMSIYPAQNVLCLSEVEPCEQYPRYDVRMRKVALNLQQRGLTLCVFEDALTAVQVFLNSLLRKPRLLGRKGRRAARTRALLSPHWIDCSNT